MTRMCLTPSRPVGEVVHTEDVLPPAQYADHRFYREFWTPNNVRSFVGAKVAEDDRCVSCIGIMRALDLPPYCPEELQLAGRYFRQLAAAMRISKFLDKVRSVALVGYGLMESSERPMILIDQSMTIVAANTAARGFLHHEGTLLARDEVLRCAAPENERVLGDALNAVFGTSASEAARTSKRTAVRLRDRRSGDVMCSLWRLKPEETMGAFGASTLVLLTVAIPQGGFRADPVLLASMFDLTPAEARVALAILDGDDPTKIAQRSCLSVATIRSHLKSLFAKTNTHRQAELVHLLLSTIAF